MSQFADEVDEACGGARVTTIDIGGGLPANAESDETSPTWGEYAAALRAAAPALFAGGRLDSFPDGLRTCTPGKSTLVMHTGEASFVLKCFLIYNSTL